MQDEFPGVQLGDWVMAMQEIKDEGRLPARVRAIGHIVGKERGCFPTVLWERTGMRCDCDPRSEIQVLCDADFARRPETTPGYGGKPNGKRSSGRS